MQHLAQPQAGILPEPNAFALFLVLQVRDPKTDGRSVAQTAARIPVLARKLGKLDRVSKLVCTVSFGSEYWDILSPKKRPSGLRPFKAVAAGGRTALNTGGDLLVHVISRRHDLNFELAWQIRKALGEAAVVKDEVHGFRYLDGR